MIADRNVRQAVVAAWVTEVWGTGCQANVHERVARILEEAHELAQAEGLPRETADRIAAHVWDRQPGDPIQELGGVCVTVLAYAARKGVSADLVECDEIARVLGKPVDGFRAKGDAKAAAGIRPSAPPPLDVWEATRIRNGRPGPSPAGGGPAPVAENQACRVATVVNELIALVERLRPDGNVTAWYPAVGAANELLQAMGWQPPGGSTPTFNGKSRGELATLCIVAMNCTTELSLEYHRQTLLPLFRSIVAALRGEADHA